MAPLKFYLTSVLTERQWSWALAGAFYLFVALFLRSLLFRAVLRETKEMDRQLYSELLRIYLRYSIPGWVLFTISFLLFVALWIGWPNFSLTKPQWAISLFLLPLLFLLSVISHYRAFAKALLTLLRQRIGVEKEF